MEIVCAISKTASSRNSSKTEFQLERAVMYFICNKHLQAYAKWNSNSLSVCINAVDTGKGVGDGAVCIFETNKFNYEIS